MKNLVLLFFIGFTYTSVLAQEGIPIFQDYLTSSWYLIHPSFAGAANTNQVRLTSRTQWLDVEDAPTLFTGSINGRISPNIGIGITAFSDTNGNFSQSGGYATFAYHINMSSRGLDLSQLSFGISLAGFQQRLDERNLLNPRNPDPAINGNVISDKYLNADFGASYLYNNFFIALSLKNALPISKDDFILTANEEPENQTQYVSTFGYTFQIKRTKLSLEPSILYLTTPKINDNIADLNIKGYYSLKNENKIWGGVSYRTNFDGAQFTINNNTIQTQRFQSISPFIGGNYKNFVFAYTYSNQLNDVKISDSGLHQITLGYDFKDSKNYRNGPRKCNCPAFK